MGEVWRGDVGGEEGGGSLRYGCGREEGGVGERKRER